MSIIKTVLILNYDTGEKEMASSKFAISNNLKIWCPKCGTRLYVRGGEVIHPLEEACPLSDKLAYWYENRLSIGKIFKRPIDIKKVKKVNNIYLDFIGGHVFLYEKSRISKRFFLVDIQRANSLDINPIIINDIRLYKGLISYLKKLPIKVAIKKLLYLIMVESNGVDLEANPITAIDAIPFISKILDIPFEIVKRYI